MVSKARGLFNALPIVVQNYMQFCAGWFSVCIGIIGVLLPIIPGTPFLLLGGWLLGWKFTFLGEVLSRFPVLQPFFSFLMEKKGMK